MVGDLRLDRMGRHFNLLLVVFAVGFSLGLSQDDDDVTARCPNNLPHTTAMKLFQGTCYQFVSQEKYWQQARDHCLLNGGRLVKVDDPQTNEFIVGSLNSISWRNRGIWIGLHDITSEMEWQWTGYELYTNEPVHWTNWGRGHPGAFLHSRRDCVRMVRGDGDWKWHETFCHTLRWHYRFICEYTANTSRSAASGNQQLSRIPLSRMPSPANHAGSSMLEGFNDGSHSWDSGDVRAVAAVQTGEDKAVDEDRSMKNGSGIIAVAVGCILFCTLVIVIAFVLYRRRQKLRRYVEDDDETFSKGKDPIDDDDVITEESKPVRPRRAVANIYVTSDVTGHDVTTRLASSSKPDVIIDSDSSEDEDYDDYDDGEELRRGSQLETPQKEGKVEEPRVENGKPKSPNIYSEVTENYDYPDSSHIYEALDEVEK